MARLCTVLLNSCFYWGSRFISRCNQNRHCGLKIVVLSNMVLYVSDTAVSSDYEFCCDVNFLKGVVAK